MSEGFDDIEMNNLDKEKEEKENEENEENEETSFEGDDLEGSPVDYNRSININTENPKSEHSEYRREFNRFKYILDAKKDTGSIRRLITGERKKSFKKYLMLPSKRKTDQIIVYCWTTLYLLEIYQEMFPLSSKVKRLVFAMQEVLVIILNQSYLQEKIRNMLMSLMII